MSGEAKTREHKSVRGVHHGLIRSTTYCHCNYTRLFAAMPCARTQVTSNRCSTREVTSSKGVGAYMGRNTGLELTILVFLKGNDVIIILE